MCNYVAYNRFYKDRFLHLFFITVSYLLLLVTDTLPVFDEMC